MSTKFQELLAELNGVADNAETLAKAVTAEPVAAEGEQDEDADDSSIQAAAAEAGAGDAPAAADGDEPVLGKSFEVIGDDGQAHEAVDATELVKSLIARADKTEDTLAKALGALTGLAQKQGDMIKSLSDQVKALSSQGRGRKTMLTVVEKPDAGTLAKSNGANEGGITPQEFFAKAEQAFDAGRISGKDLNVISVSLRGGHAIDPSLIKQVASA